MSSFTNIQTKAYVVDAKGAPFILRDVILDQVHNNELLVEIKYTGLCHTDVVVQQGGMPIGSYPAVLGHEGVGIVRRVGPLVANKSLSPGDTVLLSLRTCNACRPCRSGSKGACEKATEMNFVTGRPGSNTRPPISLPDGTPVHGQFFGQSSLSQMAIVSQHSVIKLEGAQPRDLPFLPPLACGYLTGAGTVFNVLQPTGEDTVAVLGAGAVGFAAIMAARARGARAIVAVDILDEKLEIALSLGATHVVNTRETTDLAAGLRAIFPQGVDRIVDTTGLPALLNKAFEALAHHGILALVGVPPPTADVQFNALELLTGCKRVIGVIEGWADPQKIVPELLKLYKEGKFPIDRISKTYPADSLDTALADLKAGRVIKPILSW